MDTYTGLDQVNNNWSGLSLSGDYAERVDYDANGNILTYSRYADGGLSMDELEYHYNKNGSNKLINNRLNYVTDQIGDGDFTVDIDGQSQDNYEYDAIGNLIKDVAEGIDNIYWTVYGKISRIEKSGDPNGIISIEYTYDASGNRISKRVTNESEELKTTWYVRDASGNVMAVYTSNSGGENLNDFEAHSLSLTEHHLYGSSRLGIVNRDVDMKQAFSDTASIVAFTRGLKSYELSNHLGNVLVTISDKKDGVDINSDEIIDYFVADVVTAQDYYPFGMLMPGRKYQNVNGLYKFGFQNQEFDNEVYGEGNNVSYNYRNYDPRLGRFMKIDPLFEKFPHYSPYHFSANQPVHAPELEGLESSHDLNSRDQNVHLMLKWSKEDGQGGSLLNNKYFNTYNQARNKAFAMGAAIALTFYIAPVAAIKLGLVGATMGGAISWLRGGDSYDIAKGTFTGFYSGAALAGGPSAITNLGSLLGIAARGGFSGIIGSAAEQTFDNVMENKEGVDVKKLIVSGAIGAFANVFSTALMQTINSQIDEMVTKALANTETQIYRETIQSAVRLDAPAMGQRALNAATNKRLKEIRVLIKKQGEQFKSASKVTIELATEALQEEAKDER